MEKTGRVVVPQQNLASKTVVIFNPAAKGERAARFEEELARLHPDVLVRETHAPASATEIAREAAAAGCRRIVAAGGDGTINQVVNGCAENGDVTLGVLPIGTMNVFAAELGIPSDLSKAWDLIESRSTRAVDLGTAGEFFFVQLGGAGLDAQVVKETSWDFRKTFGPLSYLVSMTQIAARKPPRITVETAEGERARGSFVLVGNGRYYGGPFELFKRARNDDGKLDALVFRNLSHFDIVRYIQGVIFGTHVNMDDVQYLQSAQMRLEADEEVPMEVDGEVMGVLPVTMQIAPHRLRVFAPEPENG